MCATLRHVLLLQGKGACTADGLSPSHSRTRVHPPSPHLGYQLRGSSSACRSGGGEQLARSPNVGSCKIRLEHRCHRYHLKIAFAASNCAGGTTLTASTCWCQQIHQRAALRAGLRVDQRLQDRRPAPTLAGGAVHAQYVDLIVAGTDPGQVADAVRSVVSELRRLWLKVHEIEEGVEMAELPGWSVDGAAGVVGPSRRRLWRVRLGLRAPLARERCIGADLERVVGHMTFISLVARPSAPHTCSCASTGMRSIVFEVVVGRASPLPEP